MKSTIEQIGGAYRQEGDYLLPNLALPDTSEYRIGKYGLSRRHLYRHVPERNSVPAPCRDRPDLQRAYGAYLSASGTARWPKGVSFSFIRRLFSDSFQV